MTDCLICFDPHPTLLTLSCGCRVCDTCFYNWAKSYCEDNILSDTICVPCPFQSCRSPIPPEKVLSLLLPQYAARVNSLMLKHYIAHQKDIKSCPKCDYAGINDNCAAYICEKCHTKWQDSENVYDSANSYSWLERFLKIANQKKEEFFSNLVKLYIGNYCPNCSIRVDKEGGCSHVVCARCKYEFCWYCLGRFYGYQHQPDRPCGLRVLYMMFIIGFIGLSVFLQISSIIRLSV